LNDIDLLNLKKIHYVVFDCFSVNDSVNFSTRIDFLNRCCNGLKFTKVVKTEIVKNELDITRMHIKYTLQNFEGIMIRNFEGKYSINSRSKNLQKLKTFITEEFEIIGANTGINTEDGCVIWVVKTKKDQVFNVRPIGSFEERKVLYKTINKYIGKFLTVKFQEYTTDGIPRFPVGLSVRDYE